MQCAERRDLILLLAAGGLEPAEEKELRAHLATGCPACAGALAEAQAVWSEIHMGLSPVQPSPAAKELLRIKVEGTNPQAQRGPIPISRGAPAPIRRGNWTRALALSGIAAAVACLVTYYQVKNQVTDRDTLITHLNKNIDSQAETISSQKNDLATLEGKIAQMSDTIRNADSVKKMLMDKQNLMLVNFQPQNQSPGEGAMLWNSKDNAGMFIGSKMKQADAGHVYELWLIVGTDKMAAGKITVDADGNAMMPVVWRSPVKPGVFAVTDEPERDNITAPQGTMMMKVNAD